VRAREVVAYRLHGPATPSPQACDRPTTHLPQVLGPQSESSRSLLQSFLVSNLLDLAVTTAVASLLASPSPPRTATHMQHRVSRHVLSRDAQTCFAHSSRVCRMSVFVGLRSPRLGCDNSRGLFACFSLSPSHCATHATPCLSTRSVKRCAKLLCALIKSVQDCTHAASLSCTLTPWLCSSHARHSHVSLRPRGCRRGAPAGSRRCQQLLRPARVSPVAGFSSPPLWW